MSSFAESYDRRAAPEEWETTTYAVRRLGCASWVDGLTSLTVARSECAIANRTRAPGHRVYAKQRYIGESDQLRGTTRTVEL